MTITLGGLTLSPHLYLDGIDAAPGIAWSARRTLGGRQCVQAGPTLAGGRTLTLQAEGHVTHAQVAALKILEQAGLAVTLSHPRGTFSVLITAVELEPDQLLANPGSAAAGYILYSGTITMIEV